MWGGIECVSQRICIPALPRTNGSKAKLDAGISCMRSLPSFLPRTNSRHKRSRGQRSHSVAFLRPTTKERNLDPKNDYQSMDPGATYQDPALVTRLGARTGSYCPSSFCTGVTRIGGTFWPAQFT